MAVVRFPAVPLLSTALLNPGYLIKLHLATDIPVCRVMLITTFLMAEGYP